MDKYETAFFKQLKMVEQLQIKLTAAESELQKLCPHVDLSGRSTFPSGLGHTDCTLCGMSSYYLK